MQSRGRTDPDGKEDEVGKLELERNKLRDEERSIVQQLRELRPRLQELRTQLQDHRDKRDQLNETIKVLKKERDELRNRAREHIQQFTEVRKSTPSGRRAVAAEKELAALEWKVQTSILDRDEEKRLMRQIASRESQVIGNRKLQDLRGNIDKYKRDGDLVHAKIQELALESQKHHLEIVKIREEQQAVRQEIDEKEALWEVTREKAIIAAQKYLMARNQSRYSSRIIRTEKDRLHRETLKAAAKEKLDKGGKLSLLELNALYEGEGDDEDEREDQAN